MRSAQPHFLLCFLHVKNIAMALTKTESFKNRSASVLFVRAQRKRKKFQFADSQSRDLRINKSTGGIWQTEIIDFIVK